MPVAINSFIHETFIVSKIEATINTSIQGDLPGNTSVTIEAEDVRMEATSYLMFKIGNIPDVINFAASKWV